MKQKMIEMYKVRAKEWLNEYIEECQNLTRRNQLLRALEMLE